LIKIASIKHNIEEKKNGKFVLKPFQGSLIKTVKKPVRSAVANQPAVKPTTEAPVVGQKVKTAQRPVPSSSSTARKKPLGLGLNSLLNPEEKTAVASGENIETRGSEGKRNQPYTTEIFLDSWKEMALKFKRDENIGMYNILVAHNPKVIEGVIQVQVHNTIQESQLKNTQGEVLSYLKNALQNDDLRIEISIVKEEKKSANFYTDQDKYNLMKEKSPSIEYFRKKFNLDIEF
jgi:hypothetical protein